MTDILLQQERQNYSNPTTLTAFSHVLPDSTFVRIRCIIQDNGLATQYSPLNHPCTLPLDETHTSINFLLRDIPPHPYILTPMLNTTKLIEKQPHCCILIHDSSIEANLSGLSLSTTSGDPVATLSEQNQQLINAKLPGIPINMVCIVKTMGDLITIPLNTVVDVYGLISYNIDNESNSILDLVPTIHCIYFNTYDQMIVSDPVAFKVVDMKHLRDQTITSLQGALMNDKLAAEYLYLSLFSGISKRVAGVPSGMFNINVYHESLQSARPLLTHLSKLKDIVAYIPFNIETFNKTIKLQPELTDKGLIRGELQAPKNTLFLVDETEMKEGTLLDPGVANFKALQSAIEDGRVAYKGEYGDFDQDCDFSFVVAGTSKSLLSSLVHIPLVPSTIQIESSLDLDQEKVRKLIIQNSSLDFKIEETMEESIHAEFAISQRLAREQGKPVDDGSLLLIRLVVAEHICKSLGLVCLDQACWDRSGSLERERLARL